MTDINQQKGKYRGRHYLLFSTLIFLVVLGGVLPRGVRALLIQMMIFSIFAMGYDMSLGYTNQCSLGHSAFFGVGAYGVVLSMSLLKLGVLSSLGVAVLVGTAAAFLTGLVSVRLSEAYFVIVTALFSAIFHLLSLDMSWLTGGDDGLTISLPKIVIGPLHLSLYNPLVNYFFVLFFLTMSYGILKRMVHAPLGRVFIAIRENEKRTRFLGYNIFSYKLMAFVISGIFTALSGGLYALTLRYATTDFFSLYWSIIPIVWCLVGGLGSLVGPCIGVLFLSLFQYYVSAWWTHYLILFGVLILVILRVSRKGIVGYVERYLFGGHV